MEDNQAARSSDKAQKSGKFRALEVIVLYICLPSAVFTLLFIGMKQLLGYRRPTSAWVLIGAGIALVLGWAVYLVLRKKPFSSNCFLYASVLAFMFITIVSQGIPHRREAEVWLNALLAVSAFVFFAALVYWIIKHTAISFTIVCSIAYMLLLSLTVYSFTEIYDGKATATTYIILAAIAVSILLLNLPHIRKRFRKNDEPPGEDSEPRE